MFCGIQCPLCYSRRVQNLGLEYRCKACYNRWDTPAGVSKKMVDQLSAARKAKAAAPVLFDLVEHLRRQQEFSERTFGPGERTAGVLDHIRKELREIEAAPDDITEWVDVVLLALDGAWRAGHTPEGIAQALADKQRRNESRQWPDWRTAEPGKAIEHVRQPGEGHSKLEASLHPDDLAVDAFAAVMKEKLRRSREKKGRGGWQAAPAGPLTRMLLEHLEKGDPVDVANFCMMLHQKDQRIDPSVVKAYQKAIFTEQGEI